MSDQEQTAEETGHKQRKKKASQRNLQGEEVEVAEGWTVDDPVTKQLKQKALFFAKQIEAISHIDGDTVQTVIAHKDKPVRSGGKKRENIHTFAECMKVRPVFSKVAEAQGAYLAPFVLVFYPVYFKEPESRREEIMIHELYHIKPPNENTGKMALRPHWGFGDNDIEKLHKLIKN